jgi:hypothetical protein
MSMTLSSGTILRPSQVGVNDTARWLAAVVCAGSAGVHAALVPEHLHESALLGAAFALDAVLLAVAATRVGRPRSRNASAVACLLAGTALAYVLSRTTGVPVLVTAPEPLDGLGALTTSSELVGVLACLLLILRREPR